MVALGHIKKFVKDHPQDFPKSAGRAILKRAESFAAKDAARTIPSGHVKSLLGDSSAQKLFNLMGTDIAYLRISAKAIAALAKSKHSRK